MLSQDTTSVSWLQAQIPPAHASLGVSPGARHSLNSVPPPHRGQVSTMQSRRAPQRSRSVIVLHGDESFPSSEGAGPSSVLPDDGSGMPSAA